ncbi:SRPBCC family protein [Variovorax sp. J22G21]|uniref:SRPBCC family protein n=1 Tax=Variovorax fucosicus TaxID=3053517 RepID=UPI0025783F5D|nr:MULTISPECIES: SRPBCC family protein [unclassified Variovorax]MDM0039438.1 SRPBCC family protein [Variovorax sp. J22R193]MDM0064213.1 SRPBCC family protein [Variovorax sp. J22G21]
MTTEKTPASHVLTRAVACDWQRAYAVAADPARLPEWASGLAKGRVLHDGSGWLAETPAGRARLRFVPANTLGVLDHWVTPEGMAEVYVPFRVIATGFGRCELQLTLLRQPGMDDAAFARDSAWIAADLEALRQLLEADGR